jgi:hypothetical protein
MPMRVRDAMASAGVDAPDEIMPLIEAGVGPMLAAIDALAGVDFGSTEPFSPSRLLVDARPE